MNEKKFNMDKSGVLKCVGYSLIAALLFFAAAPGTLVAGEGVDQDRWQLGAEFYMWGASIAGESATGEDIDIEFSDLIDNLEFAFMGAFGARKGRWLFLADVIYLDVGDDSNHALGPGIVLSDVGMKSWILTPAVGYTVIQDETLMLDIIGGARYLYLKAEIELDVGPIKIKTSDSGDVWDAIVGIRGRVKLGENWYVPYHLDVGTGDTDLTWQLFGGIGYQFKKFDLVAGYRYLKWDFDNNEVFNDLDISGPFVGFVFRF